MDLFVWLGLPVVVFWAVGAYNRLVRLRAEVKHSFAGLVRHWRQQLQVAESSLPAQWVNGLGAHSMDMVPAADRPWIALKAASTQFVASLDAAQTRPLDPASVAALRSAQDVLVAAWARVIAGLEEHSALPGIEPPHRKWDDQWQLTDGARCRFNDAVQAYNDAISQFPARLLAWLFSFRPGRSL